MCASRSGAYLIRRGIVSRPTPSPGSPALIVIRWSDPFRRWGFAGAILGVGLIPGISSLVSTSAEDHTAEARLQFLGAAVVAVVLAWRLAAWCLEADTDRVVVRNCFLTRRIPWARIAAFEDGWTHDEGGTDWVLRIVLDDGSSVLSTATSWDTPQLDSLVWLARRHGVRVRFEDP
jgi:hypothetical protein